MSPILVEPLPYRPDSAEVFAGLAAEPWAVFLDSGAGGAGGGRWDILTAGPRLTLRTFGRVTECCGASGVCRSTADPLDLLRAALGKECEPQPDLPFVGGAIGWFGYDLARRFEGLGLATVPPPYLPQMAVGIYDWALVVDHVGQTTWLVGQGDRADPRRLRLRAVAVDPASAESRQFAVTGPLASNLDLAAYRDRFGRAQRYIEAGDCYQVNLARRFSAQAVGDPWRAYLHLRAINPAPCAAFLNTPGATVLSASPERFLTVRAGMAETFPIKGTTRRDADVYRDRALAAELAASPKDRAENLMIVDLMRNDLGRSCRIGSVRVPRLFAVESFAGLHHLVSTVTGRVAAGVDALALLRGAFPGGSITGAPKRRSMQIIDELEGEARGVYCGALGYLGFDGAMDTSIAIRTMTYAGGELRFWAGGGLVADSRCEDEWAEIALKARAMLALVGKFRDLALRGGALQRQRLSAASVHARAAPDAGAALDEAIGKRIPVLASGGGDAPAGRGSGAYDEGEGDSPCAAGRLPG